MSRIWAALSIQTRTGIGLMLQYRGEILLWSLWGIINPTVLYVMWSAAASGNITGQVVGLDRGGFAAYFLIMMIAGHVTTAWDVYEMGYFVRSGSFSPKLLQPILPIWHSLAGNLSYKIATLAFVVPVWIIFALIIRPNITLSLVHLPAGLLALLLASALSFITCYTVALAAFWAPKLDALGEIYFGLGMFLGGRFCPLDALPGPIAIAASALPFRWMFAFPTELLMGRICDPTRIAHGLLIQSAWLAASILAFKLLWRAAVKRYTAVSG